MSAGQVTIVMYHYIRELKGSRYPRIKALPVAAFKNQLKCLKKNYYIISMEELFYSLESGHRLPKKAAMLTFDDALIDHFINAFPILNELNICGSFFLCAQAIKEDKVLDVNKIHFILALAGNERKLISDIYTMLDEFRSRYPLMDNRYYFQKLAISNRFDTKEVIFIKRILQKELPEELRREMLNRLFRKYVTEDEGGLFQRVIYEYRSDKVHEKKRYVYRQPRLWASVARGPAVMKRNISSNPHGIMFHHFHDDLKHPPSQGSITAYEFDNMLSYLTERYNLLSAEAWRERALAGALDNRDICITFDDNLRCQFDIAFPVLESHGIKAFWFVYTSPLCNIVEKLELYRYFRTVKFANIDLFYGAFRKYVDNSAYAKEVQFALKLYEPDSHYLNAPFYSRSDKIFRYIRDNILKKRRYEEIMDNMLNDFKFDYNQVFGLLWNDANCMKRLDDKGHIIGLHSHTHPTTLEQLSYDEQRLEYSLNYKELERLLNKKITCMSHPSNSYNDNTLTILKDLGVDIGFRADMVRSIKSSLEYPRLDHSLLKKEIKG